MIRNRTNRALPDATRGYFSFRLWFSPNNGAAHFFEQRKRKPSSTQRVARGARPFAETRSPRVSSEDQRRRIPVTSIAAPNVITDHAAPHLARFHNFLHNSLESPQVKRGGEVDLKKAGIVTISGCSTGTFLALSRIRIHNAAFSTQPDVWPEGVAVHTASAQRFGMLGGIVKRRRRSTVSLSTTVKF